ncbi:MAG TPA: hypothetical protein VMU41_11080 [Candidatus Binataceae bacterium]|nr:hypothetical protein [Candidatus Binataceae bacterium]
MLDGEAFSFVIGEIYPPRGCSQRKLVVSKHEAEQRRAVPGVGETQGAVTVVVVEVPGAGAGTTTLDEVLGTG